MLRCTSQSIKKLDFITKTVTAKNKSSDGGQRKKSDGGGGRSAEKRKTKFVQGKMSVKKFMQRKPQKKKFMHKVGPFFILNQSYNSAKVFSIGLCHQSLRIQPAYKIMFWYISFSGRGRPSARTREEKKKFRNSFIICIKKKTKEINVWCVTVHLIKHGWAFLLQSSWRK